MVSDVPDHMDRVRVELVMGSKVVTGGVDRGFLTILQSFARAMLLMPGPTILLCNNPKTNVTVYSTDPLSSATRQCMLQLGEFHIP